MQAERFKGPAVIVQGERRVVVDCAYEVRRLEGTDEWHGRFESSDPAVEPEPAEGEILVGGRRGSVKVVSVATGSESGRFEGNGAPPK